ncbi:MAG: HugZ family protein [Oceanobacter sp.]
MKIESKNEDIRHEYERFISGFDCVTLATTNSEGIPECSYAPSLQQDDAFYVFVSELATHTTNLLFAIRNQTPVSLMLIQPEAEAKNLFARSRAVIQVWPESVERDSEHWREVVDAMHQKFGETITLLRTLTDFQLIRLTPESANYVTGFGKAYRLSGKGLSAVEHQKR